MCAVELRDSTTLSCIHFSGDLGDFASFVTHMKKIAIVRPFELLWTCLFYTIPITGKGCRPPLGRLR